MNHNTKESIFLSSLLCNPTIESSHIETGHFDLFIIFLYKDEYNSLELKKKKNK